MKLYINKEKFKQMISQYINKNRNHKI